MLRKGILLLRTVAFNATFFPLTLLWAGGLVLITLPFPAERGLIPGIVIWLRFVEAVLLRGIAGIRVEVRGLAHVPTDRAVILLAKHMSNLDPIVTFVRLPRMTALAKKELFQIPFIGAIFRKLGIVRIDRQSGRAHEQMPQVLAAVKSARRPLVVYPEGTRVRPGERRKLKSGAFYLQLDGDIPVVPVATNSGLHWPKGLALIRPGTVIYEFGPPLPHVREKERFLALTEEHVLTRSDALMRADPVYREWFPQEDKKPASRADSAADGEERAA